jgi:hypothetical protein
MRTVEYPILRLVLTSIVQDFRFFRSPNDGDAQYAQQKHSKGDQRKHDQEALEGRTGWRSRGGRVFAGHRKKIVWVASGAGRGRKSFFSSQQVY